MGHCTHTIRLAPNMSSRSSSPGIPLTSILSPDRRTPASMQIDPEGSNAAEPKVHSNPSSANSTQSELLHHEMNRADPPTVSNIPYTTPPTPMSPKSHDQTPSVHSNKNRRIVLRYLVRRTAFWTLGGIIVMLLGIALIQVIIFPKIRTCPPSATCPGSYDPNNGNSLQLLSCRIGSRGGS